MPGTELRIPPTDFCLSLPRARLSRPDSVILIPKYLSPRLSDVGGPRPPWGKSAAVPPNFGGFKDQSLVDQTPGTESVKVKVDFEAQDRLRSILAPCCSADLRKLNIALETCNIRKKINSSLIGSQEPWPFEEKRSSNT
ncbi:hypothetical protein VUR80DRAFT_2120 [Thermomyces stellatus]